MSEALAELAGLRVAEVDAVAERQARGGVAEERRLHLAGALERVEPQPSRQVGLGQAVPSRRPGGDVAAAERGGDARRPACGTTGSAKPAAGRRSSER